MEALLSDGLIAVLKIDVQGALTAMRLRPDAISVFLLPPSWEELEKRIRGRGTEDSESLATRLQNAREELELADRYQFQVVNGDLHSTVADLEAILSE